MALIEFVKADDPGYKKSKGKKAAKPRKNAAKKAAAEATPAAEAPKGEGEAKS
jgi:large subunit ribosomal protein L17